VSLSVPAGFDIESHYSGWEFDDNYSCLVADFCCSFNNGEDAVCVCFRRRQLPSGLAAKAKLLDFLSLQKLR
jgi:hypothetical protein